MILMSGPEGRPPVEDIAKDVIKTERILRLVPDASQEEKMLRGRLEEFDDQLIVARNDAEAILEEFNGFEPDAKNAVYMNALRVLIKAIDETAEAKRKL